MFGHVKGSCQAFPLKAGESRFEYAYRTGILPKGEECKENLNWVQNGRKPRKIVKQLQDMLAALKFLCQMNLC